MFPKPGRVIPETRYVAIAPVFSTARLSPFRPMNKETSSPKKSALIISPPTARAFRKRHLATPIFLYRLKD